MIHVLEILKLRRFRLRQLVGIRGPATPPVEAEVDAAVKEELDTGTFTAVDPTTGETAAIDPDTGGDRGRQSELRARATCSRPRYERLITVPWRTPRARAASA